MKNLLITSPDFRRQTWGEVEALLSVAGCKALFNPERGAMSAGQICRMDRRHGLDGILAYTSMDEISAEVFECCRRLKVVSRHGVGLDNIDLEAAARHGVAVKKPTG